MGLKERLNVTTEESPIGKNLGFAAMINGHNNDLVCSFIDPKHKGPIGPER